MSLVGRLTMNYIYKIWNDYNNKIYIGITNNINRRMDEHRLGHDIKNSPIDKAINKHGWEHFSYEIIDKTEDREHAKELEQFYIKKYNSYLQGYNATWGGDDVSYLIDTAGENNPRALITTEDVKNIRIRRMNGERLSEVYEDYKDKMPNGKRAGFSAIWLHQSWPDVLPEYKDNYPIPENNYSYIFKNKLEKRDYSFLEDYFKWYGPEIKYNIIYNDFKEKIDWETFQKTCKEIVEKLYGNKSTRRYRNKNGETQRRIQAYREELGQEPKYI